MRPETRDLAPTTNHEPPTTNHEPRTTNHEPRITMQVSGEATMPWQAAMHTP